MIYDSHMQNLFMLPHQKHRFVSLYLYILFLPLCRCRCIEKPARMMHSCANYHLSCKFCAVVLPTSCQCSACLLITHFCHLVHSLFNFGDCITRGVSWAIFPTNFISSVTPATQWCLRFPGTQQCELALLSTKTLPPWQEEGWRVWKWMNRGWWRRGWRGEILHKLKTGFLFKKVYCGRFMVSCLHPWI